MNENNKSTKSLKVIYFILLVLSIGIAGVYLVLCPIKDLLMTTELSDSQMLPNILIIACVILDWILSIRLLRYFE